ncbi:hypothetical protein [Undibacterium sp. SXout20W]|uniref:hypothetical protein n=1 Tax=Undibacterium sp. SXout20W TaxID=3413051 RepID=UPI003BF049F5
MQNFIPNGGMRDIVQAGVMPASTSVHAQPQSRTSRPSVSAALVALIVAPTSISRQNHRGLR